METTNGYHASPSYTLTLRLKLKRRPGTLGKVLTAVGRAHAAVGAIDLVNAQDGETTRDLTVQVRDQAHGQRLIAALERVAGVDVLHVCDRTFLMHLGGKIEVVPRMPLKTRDELSMAYTPGVARVCTAIHDHPEAAWALTIKRNTVAVVTDGTRVLGLGDIGPEAALPVMEGKAMIYKAFGNVDAFPICLRTHDTEEFIRAVQMISPGFGGINLEDIESPRCFEIERRLRETLDIPVFHDDQHGTAIVTLAGLLNALKIVKKRIGDIKVVVLGAGAAGIACSKLIMTAGVRRLIAFDRRGALYEGRVDGMNPAKEELSRLSNRERFTGTLKQALKGADMFLGLAEPGHLSAKDLAPMARDAIVFTLANPVPEIPPEESLKYARVVGTGRSDFPNQINNALAFPGVFRGALDAHARTINEEMKVAAARAIASRVSPPELEGDVIVPSLFQPGLSPCVAAAVRAAAVKTAVARAAVDSSLDGIQG